MIRTYFVIDYSELEQMIIDKYKPDYAPEEPWRTFYSVPAVLECGNDTSHEFFIDGEIDEWDQADLGRWVGEPNAAWAPMPHIFLNQFVIDRAIEPGWYLIRVSW